MRPALIWAAFALLVSLIVGRTSVGAGSDCIITVSVPSLAEPYSGLIEAAVELGVGDGPIARELRLDAASFALCFEWDARASLPGSVPSVTTSYCRKLAGDGTSPLPAFDSSKLRNGRYSFRVSLHRIREMGEPPLVSTAVDYMIEHKRVHASSAFAAFATVKEAAQGSPAALPRMPCTWAGSFTAVAPWSAAYSVGPTPPLALAGPTVDIPLNLTGVGSSWSVVDNYLRPQFLELCRGNFPRSQGVNEEAAMADIVGWDPTTCAADIMRQTTEWAHARCGIDAVTDTSQAEAASLARFRASVNAALGGQLPSDWTVRDVDGLFASEAEDDEATRDGDGCRSLTRAFNNELALFPKVLVVGAFVTDQFVRRQRDFIFRDLLGCLPVVRLCVDEGRARIFGSVDENVDAASECASMLGYAAHHQKEWECGPCDGMGASANHVSVLISSLSQLSGDTGDGEPSGSGGGDGSARRDWALKARWRPAVIVHVNDEAASAASVVRRFYDGAKLVLRMYGPVGGSVGGSVVAASSEPTTGDFEGRAPVVVTIPVGYLSGFPDLEAPGDVPGSAATVLPRSGLEAVRAGLADLTSGKALRPLRWAFVGTRGMHHPHTADARCAMTSFLSGLEGNSVCHVTDRDGYVSGTWAAEVYRRASFVASPRGESLDCFRHYESVVSGAIPIVDQPKDHPDWSWSSPGLELVEPVQDAVGGRQPLPSWPLGWVFPEPPPLVEAPPRVTPRGSRSRPRALTAAQWPRGFTEDPHQTPWRDLAAVVASIGPAEIALRQELNARWYLATFRRLRRSILAATTGQQAPRAPLASAKAHAGYDLQLPAVAVSADDPLASPLGCERYRGSEAFSVRCVVADDQGLQKAVRHAVHLARDHAQYHAHAHQAGPAGVPRSKVAALIEIAVPRIVLSRTLAVAGGHLVLALRATTAHPSTPLSTGGAPSGHCALDGGGSVRVLHVSDGAALVLDGVSVERGFAFGHGAGCSVTGRGSLLVSGWAPPGLGPHEGGRLEGELRVANIGCVNRGAVAFRSNEVLGFGGGALFVGAGAAARLGPCDPSPSLENGPAFEGNVAGSFGGAVAAVGSGATVVLAAASFAVNSAYRGGAVAVADGAALWANGGSFQGNTAYWDGGALYVNSGNATVGVSFEGGAASGTAFVGNSASLGGAAVHATGVHARVGLGLQAADSARISDPHLASPRAAAVCSFTGNAATYGGVFGVRNGAALAVSVAADGGSLLSLPLSGDLGAEGLASKAAWRITPLPSNSNNHTGAASSFAVMRWAG